MRVTNAPASNSEVYGKTVRPKNLSATWRNHLSFLQLFSGLRARRAYRLSLVKDLNMTDPAGYAELIKIGKPQYVEVRHLFWVAQEIRRRGSAMKGCRTSKRYLILRVKYPKGVGTR